MLHCFVSWNKVTPVVIAPYKFASIVTFSLSIADLENRETKLLKLALVINLDVKDNHEEAAIGGKLALDLCQRVRTRPQLRWRILFASL